MNPRESSAGAVMEQIPRGPCDLATLGRHGDRRDGEGGPALDFRVTLNPLGPPMSVVRALRAGIPEICRYPDPDVTAFRRAAAAAHDVEVESVVAGNGTSELITAIPPALGVRAAAVVEPTYTEYLRASLQAGLEVRHWRSTAPDLRPGPFDPGDAGLVWLGSPNNPTGYLWPADEVTAWVEAHPRVAFVVDESYLPFLPAATAPSLATVVSRHPNLIVLRSLTKLYRIPGLRLGYLLATPALAAKIRDRLPPWSVNVLAQLAGAAALDDTEFLFKSQLWREAEGNWCADRLAAFEDFLEPLPSRAPFLLMRLRERTAPGFIDGLRRRRVAVRDASNFVGLDERFIRVSLRLRRENFFLLTMMRAEFLGLPVGEPAAPDSPETDAQEPREETG